MNIDYSISRVDDLGAMHEATFNSIVIITKNKALKHIMNYTGIQITYPSDYPNYALRNVRIWYSLESILQ